jgi:hypothetical protein
MKILLKLIETDWLPQELRHGWGNGYIGLPPRHPWYQNHYDTIDVNIHGGLTYSDHYMDKITYPSVWWIGFDTNHCMDNRYNCTKAYVENETEYLKKQAVEAWNKCGYKGLTHSTLKPKYGRK